MERDNEELEKKTVSRVFLVDDHAIFLEGVRTLLKRNEQVEIVGIARDGKEAFNALHEIECDLLITDINMPKMDGIELTAKIKEKFPEMKVLVLSVDNEKEMVHKIIEAEAEGYILKTAGRRDFFKAIDRILNGGTYYSNEVLSVLMRNAKESEGAATKRAVLTARELEILSLVCEELSSNEIAEKLFISPRTVETHRKNMMAKTGSKTLVGLIRFAFENKIAVVD